VDRTGSPATRAERVDKGKRKANRIAGVEGERSWLQPLLYFDIPPWFLIFSRRIATETGDDQPYTVSLRTWRPRERSSPMTVGVETTLVAISNSQGGWQFKPT